MNEFMPKGIKGFQIGHSVPQWIKEKIRKETKGKHFSPKTEIKKGQKLALGVKRSKKFREEVGKRTKGKHLSPKTEIKPGQHLSKLTEFKKGVVQPKMEKSSNWKGGKSKDLKGYILIYQPQHPNSKKSGYILEHRLVMEKYLGRYLQRKEIVHHKNLDKGDNKIENLFLFPNDRLHTYFHIIKRYYPKLTEKEFIELNEKKVAKKATVRRKKR